MPRKTNIGGFAGLIARVALAALALWAAPVQADEIRIPAAQARAVIPALLQTGRAGEALLLTEGLLLRDPGSPRILRLQAAALARLGRNGEARAILWRLYRSAETRGDRFHAASSLAGVAIQSGRTLPAQLWLRHAAALAPNDQQKAEHVAALRQVRAASPWRFSAALSLTPTDNANGAPISDRFDYLGLRFANPSNRPLPGLEIAGRVFAERRARLGQGRLIASAALDGTTYMLNDTARARVPGAKGSDFAHTGIELGLRWERPLTSRIGEVLITPQLSLRRDWRANDLHADHVEAGAQVLWTPDGAQVWQASIARGHQERYDRAIRSTDIWRVGLGWSAPMARGRLTVSTRGEQWDSESASVAHDSAGLSFGYRPDTAVMGLRPALSLGWDWRRDHRATYGPERREDHGFEASLSVLAERFETHGFAPEMTVSHRSVRSNVSLFERKETRLGVTFKSVF